MVQVIVSAQGARSYTYQSLVCLVCSGRGAEAHRSALFLVFILEGTVTLSAVIIPPWNLILYTYAWLDCFDT